MKIESRRVIVVVATALTFVGVPALAQNATQDRFETELFSIAPLHHFAIDSRTFNSLAAAERLAVLACRAHVIGLLEKVQSRQNALQHLTPDFAKTYATPAGFASSLVAPEASLMAAGISSLEVIENKKGIRLRFFVLTSSEGMIVTSEKSATCRLANGMWRVAELS